MPGGRVIGRSTLLPILRDPIAPFVLAYILAAIGLVVTSHLEFGEWKFVPAGFTLGFLAGALILIALRWFAWDYKFAASSLVGSSLAFAGVFNLPPSVPGSRWLIVPVLGWFIASFPAYFISPGNEWKPFQILLSGAFIVLLPIGLLASFFFWPWRIVFANVVLIGSVYVATGFVWIKAGCKMASKFLSYNTSAPGASLVRVGDVEDPPPFWSRRTMRFALLPALIPYTLIVISFGPLSFVIPGEGMEKFGLLMAIALLLLISTGLFVPSKWLLELLNVRVWNEQEQTLKRPELPKLLQRIAEGATILAIFIIATRTVGATDFSSLFLSIMGTLSGLLVTYLITIGLTAVYVHLRLEEDLEVLARDLQQRGHGTTEVPDVGFPEPAPESESAGA